MKLDRKTSALLCVVILAIAIIMGLIFFFLGENVDSSPEALHIKTSPEFRTSVKEYIDYAYPYASGNNYQIIITKIHSPNKVDVQLKVIYEYKGRQESLIKGTWIKEDNVWQPTKVKTVSHSTNYIPV